MARYLLVTVLVVLCLAGISAANDTVVVKGVGGLVPVHTSNVRMASEDLHITLDRIDIVYRFANDSDRDINGLVAFPLPPLWGEELANVTIDIPSMNPVNFVDFQAWSDGSPVHVDTEIRAIEGDRDVTEQLKDLGVPLSVLDPVIFNFNGTLTLPAKTRNLLIDKKLLVNQGDEKHPAWVADWSTEIRFFWRQRFPAHAIVALRQTYRPIVGGFYFGADPEGRTESVTDGYCPHRDELTQIRTILRTHAPDGNGNVGYGRWLEYILTTANNWKGPIGRFHLTIDVPASDDILVTCMRGLHKTGPARYELSETNFVPHEELKLLVVTTRELKLHDKEGKPH